MSQDLTKVFGQKVIDRGGIVAKGDLPSIKLLATHAFDVSIDFESLTEETFRELRELPLRKIEQKGNTVELCIEGMEISALEAWTALTIAGIVLGTAGWFFFLTMFASSLFYPIDTLPSWLRTAS